MIRKTGGNITFSGFLLYTVSTLWVIALGGHLDEPQYQPYIIRIIASETILALVGGLVGFIIVRLLVCDPSGRSFSLGRILRFLGYTLGAAWATYHWEAILLYCRGIKTGCLDPILGKDIAFYLVDLPFYENLFVAMFWIIAVSLACLLVKLFMQTNKDSQYNRVYIHIGLLLFVLAWGRCLERYDQLYWQLGFDLTMGGVGNSVLLPSVGQIFVAAMTGSFFVIFPFIRRRLPILSALGELSANRNLRVNPHFRLIRYVLAAAMIMFWHTAPQTYQSPVKQASVAGLSLPFSEANQFILRNIADGPFCINGFESQQGQDNRSVNP